MTLELAEFGISFITFIVKGFWHNACIVSFFCPCLLFWAIAGHAVKSCTEVPGCMLKLVFDHREEKASSVGLQRKRCWFWFCWLGLLGYEEVLLRDLKMWRGLELMMVERWESCEAELFYSWDAMMCFIRRCISYEVWFGEELHWKISVAEFSFHLVVVPEPSVEETIEFWKGWVLW